MALNAVKRLYEFMDGSKVRSDLHSDAARYRGTIGAVGTVSSFQTREEQRQDLAFENKKKQNDSALVSMIIYCGL